MYIMIDSGTTNTRVYLFDENTKRIIDKIKLSAGVRDNVLCEGESLYKKELKRGISEIIEQNNLTKDDIKAIGASGMICSEIGLCNIPHVQAPADTEKLRNSAKTILVEEVSDIPITFVPGIKNNSQSIDINDIFDVDMMRGEEAEILGIMELLNIKSDFTAILPGSHTKIISINSAGEIEKCQTTIAGELLSCVSQNTIIKKTLCEGLTKETDKESLIAGYEQSKKHGFNNTAFKVRCAGMFTEMSAVQLSSYFTGAVLADDIELIKEFSGSRVFVIGGSEPLKQIFSILIEYAVDGAKVIIADESIVESCTAVGAYSVIK